MAKTDRALIRGGGRRPSLLIPTESDWGHFAGDLDVASAHERFGGTSREEASRRFGHGDIIGAVDELRWMPAVPFRFYLLALSDHLQSRDVLEEGRDPASAASSFLNLVEQKLTLVPEEIAPVLDEVMSVVEYVASHQKRFRAPSKIYGNFGAKVRRLRVLAEKASSLGAGRT
jgi:hypothetical protein